MHPLSSSLLINDYETVRPIMTTEMEHLGSLAEKGDVDHGIRLLDLREHMHGVSTESAPKRTRFISHNQEEEEVVDAKKSMSLTETQIEDDLMAMRGSRLVWPEVGILRREARPVQHCKKKTEVSNNKFSLCLTIKEIEDDFMAIRGSKPPRQPEKKRSRKIQKNLDSKAMAGQVSGKDGSGTNKPFALPTETVVNADVVKDREDGIGSQTPLQEPGTTRTSRYLKDNKREVSFSVPSFSLSKKEIEDDLLVMTGSKPTERPKSAQKNFDKLFPGSTLNDDGATP